ncbi:MAG: 2-hydroxyacyl-CoA dehydratase [Dehalococcoidales bacterium]|nr:2-hydroxyacyl-CoA dehydratase [Dehalococcoidales bacterium]
MIELLELCGYGEDEIQRELPRVKKAFNKTGISDNDIENGKQRLRTFYDLELRGIRGVLRLCMKEFVDSVLVREEGRTKVIYGFMAPDFDIVGSAAMSISREIYVIHHFWAFMLIFGSIFDKMVPVFEAAEKAWLKSGIVAHCGNVKTLLGTVTLNLFPKPDLMITSGTLCETAPKTFDLLHELYDIPVCFYETCQDREKQEFDTASLRAIELEAKSLRKMVERIEGVIDHEITDALLTDTLDAKKGLQQAMRKLRQILVTSDPLPLSPTHENLWMVLGLLTLTPEGLRDAVDAVNTLVDELQERVDQGIGVVEKGAPRILAMCPGHHIDPRVEKLINDTGIAMLGTDALLAAPSPAHSNSPYEQIAAPLQASLFISPAQKIPLLIELCKELKIDGVFNRYHSGCRTVVGDALLIQNALGNELGIPSLELEWENYDPRYYHHEQYRKKLQVFKDMMVSRSKSAGTQP